MMVHPREESNFRVACLLDTFTSKIMHWALRFLPRLYSLGRDRLELIIFDITGKKIDNHPCRLESIISFILDFFFCNLFAL